MKYNFPCHIKGDTWPGINSITIKTSGIPIDLTDSKIKITVKPKYDIASPIFLEFFSEKNDILIQSPPSAGKISILPRIVDLPQGLYNYNLNVEFPTGVKKTYLKGEWEIISNISI